MIQNTSTKRHQLLWLLVIIPVLALACRLSVSGEDTNKIVGYSGIDVIENVATPTALTNPQETVVPDQPTLTETILREREEILTKLYAHVNPSVVNITTYIEDNGDVFPNSQGSGFVYDNEGHIVTNAHVVHGADQVDIAFSDRTIVPGEVIGEDLHSDLAVIKVDSLPEGIKPIPLGDANKVVVGQTVIAIGNPFGLGGTLTRGIVSALGRTIPALTPFSIPRSIQTDAAINPGNSGGPLLNLNGEVIGVNAQIQTDGMTRSNRGVGFAIPVSIVARVVPELIENGSFDWAWLGVEGTDMTPIIAKAMNVDIDKGAYISNIVEDGPAAKAGLIGSSGTKKVRGRIAPVGGDVIVAVNGEPIESFDDLLIYIALKSSPGDEVTLTILRNGELIDVPLTLGSRPDTIESLLP